MADSQKGDAFWKVLGGLGALALVLITWWLNDRTATRIAEQAQEFDIKLEKQTEQLSLAQEQARIRESHISDIRVLSEVFQVDFARFTDALIERNEISEDLKNKLLENLQRQTIQILALQRSMLDYENGQMLVQRYQEHVDLARDQLRSISDAGELNEVYEVVGEMYHYREELVVAIRELPLVPNGA